MNAPALPHGVGGPPSGIDWSTLKTLNDAEQLAYLERLWSAEIRRRLEHLVALQGNPELQAIEMEFCRRDPLYFIDNWAWTFDPRRAAEGKSAQLPLLLWPRQREMLQFIIARLGNQEDGLIEKSRDIGFTWNTGAFAVHAWIFRPGFKTVFASRKEDLVDRRGDPDSIFEKLRYLIKALPAWMRPAGFDQKTHDNHMRLLNPLNTNIISGEAGRDIGRGGRSTLAFFDEFAFVEDGDSADSASSANSKVRIFGSTVNGMGNTFARKRHDGSLLPSQIFRFHFTMDPRKTEAWALKEKRRLDPYKWASEYDIDYSASIEDVCIPAKWVAAAVELAKAWPYSQYPRRGVAALDVGAGGKGKSVWIARFGALVVPPCSWGQPDTTETALRAIETSIGVALPLPGGHEARVGSLVYDSVGVGRGVQSTLTHHRRQGLTTVACNAGDSPSPDVEWPDGDTSANKFLNLRAEMWWSMRSRFQASYQLLCLIRGEPEGQAHPISDCILLPSAESGPDAHALISQLSLPRWFRNEKGKIQIESKKQMRERGIPSPDHADALAMTHMPNPDVLEVYRRMAGAVI